MEEHHVLGSSRQLEGHRRTAPDAVGGEPAGGHGRLRLELAVCDLVALGDQRHAIGTRLGPLGEPVVEDHRQG